MQARPASLAEVAARADSLDLFGRELAGCEPGSELGHGPATSRVPDLQSRSWRLRNCRGDSFRFLVNQNENWLRWPKPVS